MILICDYCKNEYIRKRKNSGSKHCFCSLDCYKKFCSSSLQLNCYICDKHFIRKKSQLRTKSGCNFCSQSCAREYIKNNNHLNKNNIENVDIDKIIELFNSNKNLNFVLKKLEITQSSENRQKLKSILETNDIKYYIDYTLYLKKSENRLKTVTLKKALLSIGKIFQCEICKIKDWNNKPITIEIHHVNGDNTDNRIENLQLLCPNCHSQTDNYKSKNKNKKK